MAPYFDENKKVAMNIDDAEHYIFAHTSHQPDGIKTSLLALDFFSTEKNKNSLNQALRNLEYGLNDNEENSKRFNALFEETPEKGKIIQEELDKLPDKWTWELYKEYRLQRDRHETVFKTGYRFELINELKQLTEQKESDSSNLSIQFIEEILSKTPQDYNENIDNQKIKNTFLSTLEQWKERGIDMKSSMSQLGLLSHKDLAEKFKQFKSVNQEIKEDQADEHFTPKGSLGG